MYDVTEGFSAYKTYLALKSHFSSDYDFFKYNGKIRASQESFLKRKDKFFFRKLQKKYKGEELINYFVSNFIRSDANWIGNLLSQESEDNYVQWKKTMESLGYAFHSELRDVVEYCSDNDIPLNDLIIVKDGNHPPLLKMYLQKKISIESLIILNRCLKFFGHWNKNLDDIVWEETYKKIKNYRPFLRTDVDTFKKILKEIINASY